MFIPLDRKPDWHSPPLVTLLLISVNILVFAFFQGQDQVREDDAFRYYYSSGLAELEIPRYIQYLNKTNARHLNIGPVIELNLNEQKTFYQHQLRNGHYQTALASAQIITPEDADYAHWQGLRRGFDKRLQNIFSYRYALKPYLHQPLNIFSSLFLHADASHLLGNMVFLLLFGFILELSLGGGLLLLVFISCGVSANLISIAITPNSGQWILGASGAITGLAGLYAILYGMRKIRFFYSLIFYFDYVRAPAIIMLPVWLLYELAYNLIAPNSISTITHIGGLLAGVIIGLIIKYSPLNIHPDEEEKLVAQNFEAKYQDAMVALSTSNLDKAANILGQLLTQQPDDSRLLLKLFHIAKARMDQNSAQQYLQGLLMLTENNTQLIRDQQRCFLEYSELTQEQHSLPASLLASTAIRFCHSGFIESSEKILSALIHEHPGEEKIPMLLLLLSTRHHKTGNFEKSAHYKQLLIQNFSNSPEAQTIQQTLPMI